MWGPGPVTRVLRAVGGGAVAIAPANLGMSRLYFDGGAELLFTENESDPQRLWDIGAPGYYNDAFHERIIGAAPDRMAVTLALTTIFEDVPVTNATGPTYADRPGLVAAGP